MVYPGISWSNEITLSRYSPTHLERRCGPRLPHEAEAHTTTFVISAVSIIPYAN